MKSSEAKFFGELRIVFAPKCTRHLQSIELQVAQAKSALKQLHQQVDKKLASHQGGNKKHLSVDLVQILLGPHYGEKSFFRLQLQTQAQDESRILQVVTQRQNQLLKQLLVQELRPHVNALARGLYTSMYGPIIGDFMT